MVMIWSLGVVCPPNDVVVRCRRDGRAGEGKNEVEWQVVEEVGDPNVEIVGACRGSGSQTRIGDSHGEAQRD